MCHIGWPNVGLGFSWSSHDLKAFGDSCDISPWRSAAFPASARATAVQGHTFIVRHGLPFEAFNVLGRGGLPPAVSIRGPGGAAAQTNSDFSPVMGSKFLIMQIPSQSRTFIEIRDPAAGSWTVTPDAGSGQVIGWQQGDPLPPVRIHASVSGRGSARRLSWQMPSVRGQRVTFVERGPRILHRLATVRAGRGARPFTPAPGAGGRRTVIAEVEQNGLPRRELFVTSYRAAAPPRPKRAALSIVRRRHGLLVDWQASANASGYELRLALSDGRRVLADLPAGTRSYRMASVDPATGATATVRPLSDRAGNGPLTRARIQPPANPLAARTRPSVQRNRPLTVTVRSTSNGTLNLELINSAGDCDRLLRSGLRARGTRRITISTTALPSGPYTLLAAFSLDGSAKPYMRTLSVRVR